MNTWFFYSYRHHKFQSLVSGTAGGEVELGVTSALANQELFEFEEPQVKAVLTRLFAAGNDSGQFDEEERDVLDCFVTAAFKSSNESILFLEASPCSESGLLVSTLSQIRKPPSIVDIMLRGGRRFWQKDASLCGYLLFTTAEMTAICDDLVDVLTPHIRGEIVEPFKDAIASGKTLSDSSAREPYHLLPHHILHPLGSGRGRPGKQSWNEEPDVCGNPKE